MIDISIMSGKCDFSDHIDIFGLYSTLNSDIYIGRNTKKIQANEYKDLIPYLPYIITEFSCSKDGRNRIVLSSESWVDKEEREIIEFYLEQIFRAYNRCKRKKVKFIAEDAVKEVCYGGYNEDIIRELAYRVKENGRKANIKNIHLKSHEYYRQMLVNEMLNNRLNPADYGYERFIKDD